MTTAPLNALPDGAIFRTLLTRRLWVVLYREHYYGHPAIRVQMDGLEGAPDVERSLRSGTVVETGVSALDDRGRA